MPFIVNQYYAQSSIVHGQGVPQASLPPGIYAVRTFKAASDVAQLQHQGLLSSLRRDGVVPEGSAWALNPPHTHATTVVQRREIVHRIDENAFFLKCWRTAST